MTLNCQSRIYRTVTKHAHFDLKRDNASSERSPAYTVSAHCHVLGDCVTGNVNACCHVFILYFLCFLDCGRFDTYLHSTSPAGPFIILHNKSIIPTKRMCICV